MIRESIVRPVVKPGDFIGFTGRDLMSAIINVGTLGVPFWGLSHCGIVVAPLERSTLLAIFESTTLSPGPCLFSRKETSGVQAHRLHWRVSNYPGKVWHYPLSRPLSGLNQQALYDSCMSSLGMGYDFLQAFRSRSLGFGWLEKLLYGRENLTSVYCSEFIAARYREIDVFRTRNVSKWSPNKLARALIERRAVAGCWRLA